MAGSPGGHSKRCFSRNFLPSCEFFISWCSSISVDGPLRLVFGLAAVPGLGELLLLSEVDLSLLAVVGGMLGTVSAVYVRGKLELARLEALRWLCALCYACLERGKSTVSDGSGSRSGLAANSMETVQAIFPSGPTNDSMTCLKIRSLAGLSA